jgi:PAS domain S-box-containing protein
MKLYLKQGGLPKNRRGTLAESLQVIILYIDDNETNRYIICRTLQNAGFRVIEAGTGKAGLQMVAEQQPDLVILDVNLPDMMGFEVCQRIKANPDTSSIPILHLSATFINSHDKAYGLNIGADAYLVQPVEPVELIATINALLRIRKAEELASTASREWRTTFDSMRDGVALLDNSGKFVRCNQAMAKLLGQVSDITGICHQEASQLILGNETNLFTCVRETRHRESLEIQSKDKWFAVTIDPVQDEGGSLTGAVFIVADITDRRKGEEMLRFLSLASTLLSESLNFQSTLKNIVEVAVPQIADWCMVDVLQEDGSLTTLAFKHRNLDKVEAISNLVQYYSPNTKKLLKLPWVIRSQKSYLLSEISESTLHLDIENPEYFQLLNSLGIQSYMVVPLLSGKQVLGAISLISGESGRCYNKIDLILADELARRAASAIENASLYREAEKANRIKDEFLATLSHELRSPLNAMLGWVSLLKGGKFDQQTTARAMETIERNAKLLAQLVEDLLDVSRIIRGQLRLNLSNLDLASLITASLDTVRPTAQAKEIELQTQLNTLAMVMGDPDRLQQIFWNLISNAIKFTPQGGRVQVRIEREDSHVSLVVSDTGKGISPEFLPYVFERFRQADNSTSRSYAGLGLGLGIVRHLVELHGGIVYASSAGEGQGATFTVKLPATSVQTQSNRLGKGNLAIGDENSFLLDGITVVVVDNETDAREYLQVMLEQYGAQVIAVTTAQEALEAVLQSRPDVLVSDIGMPEEDGYTLIRKLRTIPPEQGGQTPAVALTAYAREEDQKQAIAAGFQVHISKPVDTNKLINAVASLAIKSQSTFTIIRNS